MKMYDTTKPNKKQILELISQTWETPYLSVKMDRNDSYPIITRKKFSFQEVDHTDGIGTKGVYHWKQRSFKNASLDALAMNLNDLVLMRAIPYKLQNHIIIPEDDNTAISEVVTYLSEECKKRNIAITGGETSIQNTTQGMDISITVSGFIKKYKQNTFQPGDILIGFKSSGLHSNGFTKVREIFEEDFRKDFIEPTNIYSDMLISLEELIDIHGMMHITGGAFTKLKDMAINTDIVIKRNHRLKPQSIFYELFERGVSDEELYKTFNCGIGFVISIPKNDISKINFKEIDYIGEVVPGKGRVIIESSFSNKTIIF